MKQMLQNIQSNVFQYPENDKEHMKSPAHIYKNVHKRKKVSIGFIALLLQEHTMCS